MVFVPAMAPPLGNWVMWMFSAKAARAKEAQRETVLKRCIVYVLSMNDVGYADGLNECVS